jgi:hypothetical protein
MTTQNTQLGLVAETTYGTPVAPTRFYEFNSCDVQLERGAVMSQGLRVGRRVQRADRFMPYTMGASGSIELDVPTKGFGIMLTHMLGNTSVGTVTDANYTQTHTIGTLLGKFLTIQAGKPRVGSASIDPFTWHGCKFTGWELACDVDGVLVATLEVDAEDEDNSTALATASYPSDYRVFTFDGCAVTVGGSSYEANSWSLSADNALKTDRRFLTGSPLKKEPLENGMRAFEVSLEGDFRNLDQYNRFKSATAAGQLAAVVATFTGPIAHGGTTLPQLVVTLPAVRFANVTNPISGPETITESITGEVVDNGTDQPVTITYRTTDAAA